MSEDEKAGGSSVLETWTQAESFSYLEIFEECRPLFSKHKATFVYSLISEKLKQFGILKSEYQCTRKFSNLIRSYRKCQMRKQPGNNQKFPYYDRIHRLQTSSIAEISAELQDEANNFLKEKCHQGNESMEDEIQEYPETTFRKTNTWTNEETLQFIQLYSVMNSEKNVWNKIVIELKQLGVHKTKAECSKKWSNLMRSYKKVNMELKRNEKNTSKFCFFSEMTQAIEASTKLDSIVGLEEFENNVLVMEVQEEAHIFMEDDEIIQRSDSDQETSNFIPEMTEETEKLEQTPTPIDQNTVFLQFFSENFMTICKICLTQKEDLKPLEEENLLKLQELFHQNQDEATNTEIDPEFLNLICEDCLESLEKFNSFKEQYVKSKIFLQQFKADYIVLDQDLWNGEEIEDAKFEVIEEIIEYLEESDQEMDFNSSYSHTSSPTQISDKKPENSKKPSIITKNPSRICEVCGLTVRVKNYKSHMMIHTGQKPFVCEICDRSFRTSSSCKIHQATHTTERNFSCPDCSKSFICRNGLAKHKLTHTREMKFGCQVCPSKFYRQSSFRTHQASHGIGVSHYCKICQKGFLWEARLKEHMYEHDGLKPFKCKYCTKTFSKQRNLSSHIRLGHKAKKAAKGSELMDNYFKEVAEED